MGGVFCFLGCPRTPKSQTGCPRGHPKILKGCPFYTQKKFRVSPVLVGPMDLTEIGDAIEITTRSLSRKFLVYEGEELGADTKCVVQFLDISRGGEIHFQDSTGVVHSHILHYAPLPHAIEFGGDGAATIS